MPDSVTHVTGPTLDQEAEVFPIGDHVAALDLLAAIHGYDASWLTMPSYVNIFLSSAASDHLHFHPFATRVINQKGLAVPHAALSRSCPSTLTAIIIQGPVEVVHEDAMVVVVPVLVQMAVVQIG